VLETTVGGETLKLTQETNYPWDGRIKIMVNAAPTKACSIALRIPGWTKDAALTIAGTPLKEPLLPGTYFKLNRLWKPGDVLELQLPMPARMLQAHPLVEEARNQVAVQRGPLVYCLESPDLPAEVKVSDVVLPRGSEWKPRLENGLLGGVVVLESVVAAAIEPRWEGQLYRDLPAEKTRPVNVKLIPYFAWSNRGPSEMTVWLPLGR